MGQNSYTFDAGLELKDAGAITADAAAQVDAADKIVDLGASSRFDGRAIIDVSALDVASGNELYKIKIQVSSSATFASGVVTVAVIELGDSSVTGNTADSTTGRYELPFTNEYDGTIYRYLRAYTDVAGTTPSINYTCWVAKL